VDSVFQFKGKNPSSQELSSQLGARYLVECSIRKVGERIRVTVQLSDAVRGIHLWSDRYDRQVADVFAVQDDITQHVAGALAIKISRLERDRAAAKPPDKLEAYDYVLRGREYLARGKPSANFEARKYFERAIALDPSYAAAFVAQGRTLLCRYPRLD
jgi:adenylate cyclase